MKNSLTLTEAAKATARPIATVNDWLAAGLRSTKRGRNRTVTTSALLRFLAARFEPGDERARYASARAKSLEMRNAREAGTVLNVDDIEQCLRVLAAELAQALAAVPARIATDAATQDRIEAEIDAARTVFADRMMELTRLEAKK
jgi:phage terminase Nu1 subunit (DNA packaging protein)